MNKTKLITLIILAIKSIATLFIITPKNPFCYFTSFNLLVLSIFDEEWGVVYFLSFLTIYVLISGISVIFVYSKDKVVSRVSGIVLSIILVTDIVMFVINNMIEVYIIATLVDVVCILLIILSLFNEAKIIKIYRRIFNKSEDSADTVTNENVYKL